MSQETISKIELFVWAKCGEWAIKHYPLSGGTEAFMLVKGIGWVLDANDDMPHDVWTALLEAVGAPTC